MTIGRCRALRIPARNVSGHPYNGAAEELSSAQASHAWLEIFTPGHVWFGFYPTNHQPTGERHVKVGRDPADVSPLGGTYRGTAERTLHVDVLVSRLDDPAVGPHETTPPMAAVAGQDLSPFLFKDIEMAEGRT